MELVGKIYRDENGKEFIEREPVLLWDILKEEDYTTYRCSECYRFFRVRNPYKESNILESHKYCGHCGKQLIL